MSQPAAVFFDLDGTLVDTAPDFVTAVNTQRHSLGLEPVAYQHIRNSVSNGARALVHLSFGYDEHHPSYGIRLEELLALYLSHISDQSRLFEGLNEVLLTLEAKGIPWGVVTNKPRRFTDPLLQGLNLQTRSAVTICPEDVQQRKPHPEPMLLACKRLNVNPTRCIYVGDHARDIESGRNAGMKTIAAQYGYVGTPQEVVEWQADAVVTTPAELTQLFESMDF